MGADNEKQVMGKYGESHEDDDAFYTIMVVLVTATNVGNGWTVSAHNQTLGFQRSGLWLRLAIDFRV